MDEGNGRVEAAINVAKMPTDILQQLAVLSALRIGILPFGRVYEIRIKASVIDAETQNIGMYAQWRERKDLTAP